MVDLPMLAFYKNRGMGDGHVNKCKECTKKDMLAYRLARIEHYRQYDRQRASHPHRIAARKAYQLTEAGRNKASAAKKSWIERNPKARWATGKLNQAISRGKMEKEPCFICGAPAEGHHASYDLPLHVTWLCDEHHKQVHKEHREMERQVA